MYSVPRPLLEFTVVKLTPKFGCGSVVLNVERFCMMIEWPKKQMKKFVAPHVDCSGTISVQELNTAFAKSGMPLPNGELMATAGRYGLDG